MSRAVRPGARTMIVSFVAGAVAVVPFHQGMLLLLNIAGLTPARPFAMAPTQPFGVPVVLSLAFWGGVWGIPLLLFLWRRPTGQAYWLAALAFGIVFPTLVAWFVVAPLKGLPVAAGWQPMRMLVGPLVNGAWGLGAALFLRLASGSARGGLGAGITDRPEA